MKFVTIIALFVFVTACSSNKPSQSSINTKEVSEKLVKLKTTQAQVLETFGAPDILEKTPDGDMWAYNRRTNESNSKGGGFSSFVDTGKSFLAVTGFGVGGDTSSSSTKTASLVMYFNHKKILKTYTYRTEQF